MAEFHDRDLFLVKKALAIAVLVIEGIAVWMRRVFK